MPLPKTCGRPVIDEPGLRERAFGEFEGLRYDEINLRWPEMAERWRQRDSRFGAPGGETLGDFYMRCWVAANRVAAAHPGQTVVLVAHGGVMDCLYRAATHQALDAVRSWAVAQCRHQPTALHTPRLHADCVGRCLTSGNRQPDRVGRTRRANALKSCVKTQRV